MGHCAVEYLTPSSQARSTPATTAKPWKAPRGGREKTDWARQDPAVEHSPPAEPETRAQPEPLPVPAPYNSDKEGEEDPMVSHPFLPLPFPPS